MTNEEHALASSCRSRSTLSAAADFAEAEWRWRHDREAFVADIEADQRAEDVRQQAKGLARNEYLKSLTLEALLSKTLFERWTSHPPFPPPEFATLARERIREAAKQLQLLGPGVKKAQARNVVLDCVEWFNGENRKFGEVIETEEREDILEALQELAAAAGHSSIIREVDRWRRW